MKSATVHPDKLSKYLLNLSHPAGAGKAKFFLARGFDLAAQATLAHALMRHPRTARLTEVMPKAHGIKHVYECSLECPDGSQPCIKSVWLEPGPGSHLIFVTAYPMTPPD